MPVKPGTIITTKLARLLAHEPDLLVTADIVGDPAVEDPQVTVVRGDGQEIFVQDAGVYRGGLSLSAWMSPAREKFWCSEGLFIGEVVNAIRSFRIPVQE